MPYYATSQEWLHQSSLLLEARPSTTRITTKYHISKTLSTRRKSKTNAPSSTTTTTTTTDKPPRGSLTLKTYDPHSGVCLKYRTTKAAEVSRLVLSLGRLGGRMAALPAPEAADEVMADAPPEGSGAGAVGAGEGVSRTGTPVVEAGKAPAPPPPPQQQGGGGKGKKKKGKK
ncbi:signal recognition particle 9 kDa protein-domain-containing protein [Whalleya microplaca]|nr:signal recognition particle 9 kDa protein-domain-containing protein [Whalleya microplaca]